MYLLDTNICIHLLNRRDPHVEAQFRVHGAAQIALCSVVKAELLYGARHSTRVEANLQRLATLFAPLRSLPFDDHCAAEYGQIRAQLEAAGTPIGPNDLMIAAIARAHDAVLVTNNEREFSRVVGLRLENWVK